MSTFYLLILLSIILVYKQYLLTYNAIRRHGKTSELHINHKEFYNIQCAYAESPECIGYDTNTNNKKYYEAPTIHEWRFGNYCVWFDFTQATKHFDENPVTLCLHGTVGYSKFVFDHVSLTIVDLL